MSEVNINREFSEFGKCSYYLAICMILSLVPYFNYIVGFVSLYFFIKSLKVIKQINSQLNNRNLTEWRSKMILAFVILIVGVILSIALSFVILGISSQAAAEPDMAVIGVVLVFLIVPLILVSISGYFQMKAWDNLNSFFEENRKLFPEIILVNCLDGTDKLRTGSKFIMFSFLLIPAIIGFIYSIIGSFKLANLRNLEAVSVEGAIAQPPPVTEPAISEKAEEKAPEEKAEVIKFCGSCGTELDPSWNRCPNCGTPVEGEMAYQPTEGQAYPQEVKAKKGKTYGSLALAFGLLSLCCFCGFIFGPLAIIFAVLGLYKDEDRSLSIIGLVLAIIGTFCGIIFIWNFYIYFQPPADNGK